MAAGSGLTSLQERTPSAPATFSRRRSGAGAVGAAGRRAVGVQEPRGAQSMEAVAAEWFELSLRQSNIRDPPIEHGPTPADGPAGIMGGEAAAWARSPKGTSGRSGGGDGLPVRRGRGRGAAEELRRRLGGIAPGEPPNASLSPGEAVWPGGGLSGTGSMG